MSISLSSIEPLIEKIEQLSKVQRILVCAGTFLLFIGAFVMLFYLPKSDKIRTLNQDYDTLQTQLATAKRNAKNLERYKKLIKDKKIEFANQMKALPDKKEIPTLLAGISQSGNEAGLEFLLFQPQGETVKEFYAEIPISIRVQGGYHSVALFFDKVARLSRIVNIKNIDMISAKNGTELTTSCTATTYRFIESSDKGAQNKEKGQNKK